MKRISIVIPCYNHTKDLKRSLQTLRNQSIKVFEVVIVDDGSTHPIRSEDLGTAAIDLPITIIRQKNTGAPAARNAGFSQTTGEYVIFWDADILAIPTMLAEMKSILDTHADVSFVYSDFYFGNKKMEAKPFSLSDLAQQNFINSASLVRREDVIAWDESLKKFQDWDFWLTLAKQGKKGLYLPKTLFKAIPHKHGISTWLPRFAYKSPWKYLPIFAKKVKEYEKAKTIIIKKHA